MRTKQIIFLALTTVASLGFFASKVRAVTFEFSGFSIADDNNSYEAQGSFDLPDGFSGDFDIETPNIPSTLSVSVNTVEGESADFTFDSSNIIFGSSTFTGTVTGQTATFETISLIANDASIVFLGDNAGGQNYNNLNSRVFLNTINTDVSGTSFNDATTTIEPVPEPITILSSLVALGFGSLFNLNQKK